jgi:beta-phosphoglucomutase-like phosphatase (HAD superfamily)
MRSTEPTANVGTVVTGSISRQVRRRAARQPARIAARPTPVAAVRRGPDKLDAIDRAPTLDGVANAWWSSLDAAETAVRAAHASLAAGELRTLSARLAAERSSTVQLLQEVARAERVPARFDHLLVSRSNLRSLLGLPSTVTACVFNLDGVLVASATLHSAAWAETLDEFIGARIERTHGSFSPFDPRTDYARHMHGKPRLDGLRAFLASRGISLPEGAASDAPGTETVYGLANRKKQALLRALDREGIRAFDGAKRYLEAARDAGIGRLGISASANSGEMIGRAGLGSLLVQCLDGDAIVARSLRARPAPDIPLEASRLLGVEPGHAAVFETTPAGVEAAHACGFGLIVGVAATDDGRPLLRAGADLVVESLAEILERNTGLATGRTATSVRH